MTSQQVPDPIRVEFWEQILAPRIVNLVLEAERDGDYFVDPESLYREFTSKTGSRLDYTEFLDALAHLGFLPLRIVVPPNLRPPSSEPVRSQPHAFPMRQAPGLTLAGLEEERFDNEDERDLAAMNDPTMPGVGGVQLQEQPTLEEMALLQAFRNNQ